MHNIVGISEFQSIVAMDAANMILLLVGFNISGSMAMAMANYIFQAYSMHQGSSFILCVFEATRRPSDYTYNTLHR